MQKNDRENLLRLFMNLCMHVKSAAAYDFAMETLLSDALALQYNNTYIFKSSTGLGFWVFVVLID